MKSKYVTIIIAAALLLITSGCAPAPIANNTNVKQPAPVDQAPVDQAPVDQAPVDQAPVDRRLDLSNMNLTTIPMYVFDQTNIVELDVSHNDITGAIQSQLRNLKNLQKLDASNNQMTGVPAEIGQLHNLKTLDLSNNLLTGLPNELGNLTGLQIFNLSGNDYSKQDLDGIRATLPNTTIIVD